MNFTYEYPRPAVTVDIIVVTDEKMPRLLLIKRKNPPCMGAWALPGGFMDMDETLIQAANRELFEETGLKNLKLEQFYTFSKVDRDPRGRTISTVFYTKVSSEIGNQAVANDDAAELEWFNVSELPELAFDHDYILLKFFKRFRS